MRSRFESDNSATLNALKATRDLVGMESTERASEYLRKFSKTPIQKLTTALGAVQHLPGNATSC